MICIDFYRCRLISNDFERFLRDWERDVAEDREEQSAKEWKRWKDELAEKGSRGEFAKMGRWANRKDSQRRIAEAIAEATDWAGFQEKKKQLEAPPCSGAPGAPATGMSESMTGGGCERGIV